MLFLADHGLPARCAANEDWQGKYNCFDRFEIGGFFPDDVDTWNRVQRAFGYIYDNFCNYDETKKALLECSADPRQGWPSQDNSLNTMLSLCHFHIFDCFNQRLDSSAKALPLL
jgi:hypothetical protein